MHKQSNQYLKDFQTKMSCLLFLLSIFVTCECANILAVFPAPSISHQVVFRPITQELAKRGHQVTVITPDPAFEEGKSPANLTEIDLHDISYAYKEKIFKVSTSNDAASQVELLYSLFNHIFETQLQDERFKKIIEDKTKKYDVLLVEACFRTTLVLSHVFKAPVIQISSLGSLEHNNYAIGSSIHPILYPTCLYHKKTHNHSFFDKIKAIYNQYVLHGIARKYEVLDDLMLKKYFGNDVPSLNEFNNNIDMLFLNVHPIWEGNRPVPPNVVYIGGLPKKPYKELPADLKSYLDSSKNGVIYVSFGTNVSPSLLPADRVRAMMSVLSNLTYDVIWKWDNDDVPGKAQNIKFGKWFPQSDMLRHPKIKLFITQGGLQSTDEAILGGVPLIGIPMLGDQWFNVDQYVKHEIGKVLEMEDLEEASFRDAVNTVIGDDSYKTNIIKLRSIMNDKPQSSLDSAIFWTEYVIKNGGARHLRSASANISWTEYYQIDIVGFTIICCIFIVYLLCVFFKLIVKLFRINVKVKNC